MKLEIKVPQQGLTVDCVMLSSWNVKVGDIVKRGDEIAVIESEKATLEVEAPESGKIVEIIAQQDEEILIGDVLAYMETEVRK